ncbi:MAG TPA: 2Fe-2S iron-sulfur cluster-binding protein [Chitinophagaceae bacterium]|nr:2Fe-2S iron-sulfur cluster-binding protein [Chitinophagaceae bacterium]
MESPFLQASAYIGIAATVVLTLNFLLGMLVSTNYRRLSIWQNAPQFIRKFNLVDVHNWTAYVALLLALVHPVLLLFDPSTKFRFIDIIFPINAPTQKIFVAMGTIALLAIIVLIITTQKVVKKKLGFRTWKNIHLTAYFAALLFLVHGLVMDPQLKNRPIDLLDAEKVLSEICFIVLVAALFFRVRYQKKFKEGFRKFNSLKISEVIEETSDAKTFVFSIPEKLKKQFTYTAGQFIILKITINDKEYKRSYSFSSCPYTDTKYQITVKRIKDGIVSNYLNDNTQSGDELLVFPSSGNFFKEPEQNVRRNYIFFAGGSGITPVYSIIKTLLAKYPNNYVKLVYANKDSNTIIFYKELETLKSLYQKRFFITHIVSQASAGWHGMTGRLDSDKMLYFLEEQRIFPIANTNYYVCGPSPFMEMVEHELQKHGVPNDKLHLERFISIGDGDHPLIMGMEPAAINLKSSTVCAKLDGKDNKVTCATDETILAAFLAAGVNAPYSCKEGVCSSCMAKLIKGKVQMLNAQSLTDIDIKENRILTCQATCLTKDVEINYDIF